MQAEKQNKIISNALDEKELLLAEIHHRVKNNLQTINSLLLLQSKTIKDENAIKAIQESQYRIQTMALVHQKLYQTTENSLGVNIRDYFRELIGTILDSLQVNRVIKFEQDIDELVLDLDTIIYIGLIVNELVVNSVKYAFKKKSTQPLLFRIAIETVNQFERLPNSSAYP